MRPVLLELKGFRSFRDRREIRFDDLALFAIVGETGAGKSSILQAICYALYGRPTFDDGTKSLVHATDLNLVVALTFDARGERWRVERSTSRGTYPPASQKLERIDVASPPVTGERRVNDKIVQLLGLSFEAFTRAVLLPQGEFQRLLLEKPGERLVILKQVLGLQRLDRVRKMLEAPLAAANARLARIEATIDAFGEDLSERIMIQTAKNDAARKLAENMARARAVVIAEHGISAAFDAERAGLAREETILADLEPLTAGFAVIRSTSRAIEEERASASAARDATQTQAAAIRSWCKVTSEAGRDATQAGTLLVRLKALVETKTMLATDEIELARESLDVERTRMEYDAGVARLAELREIAEVAAREELALLATAKAEEENRIARGLAHQEHEEARIDRDTAHDAKVASEQRLGTAATLRKEVESRLGEALAAASVAEQELEASRRRAGLFAHLDHLAPGEPCPVCDRALPSDFTPPRSTRESAAAQAKTDADKQVELHRRGVNDASAEHGRAVESLANSSRSALVAERRHAAAIERLRTFGEDPVNGSALEERLESLRSEILHIRESRDVARDLARTKASAHREAAALSEAQMKNLDAALKALARRSKQIAERKASFAASVASLPSIYAVDEELRGETIDAMRDDLSKAVEDWNAEKGRLEALDADALSFERRLTALERRHSSEIVTPLTKLVPTASALSTLFSARLKRDVAIDVLSESTAVEEQLRSLQEAATEIRSLIAARKTVVDQLVDASRARVALVRAETGVSEAESMDDSLEAARVTAAAAAGELADLLRRREEKDASVAERASFAPSVEALRALSRLMNDSRFPAYVVRIRQSELLTNASIILQRMTNDRYGFAEDFSIVDVRIGQERSVRSLSGGETFLASLALALALSEISAAGGSAADALFLDEGFGTLDDETLVSAFEELQRRSAGGRLIGVVSHVKAVSDHVEHVLRVTPGVRGSDVYLAGDDDLLDDAMEAISEALDS